MLNMPRDISRRVLFDTVAELYKEMRPSYPPELLGDAAAFAGLTEDSRLLEIGAGAGQATVVFAKLGCPIVSLELGANLAEQARQAVLDYPLVEVLNVKFEDWELEESAFDLVFSGSAFHWIPPEIGYARCAQALRPGGSIALFWNGDPRPEGGVYEAVQRVYERVAPEMSRGTDSGKKDTARIDREAMVAAGFFEEPVYKEYPWTRLLSAEDYARLCCTYSDHIALPDEQREELCRGIIDAINAFGGTFERKYLTKLYLAKLA